MRHSFVQLTILVLIVSLIASPASATTDSSNEASPDYTGDEDAPTQTDTDATVDVDGNSGGVEVTRITTIGGSQGRRRRPPPNYPALWGRFCHYTTNYNSYTTDFSAAADYSYASGNTVKLVYVAPSDTEGNALYRADCTRADGTGFPGGVFNLPEGSGVGAADPILLRDNAAAKIVINGPKIDTSPSFTERHTIVRIQTWLWVTDPWQNRTETEADGDIDVAVTATPTQVTWEFSEPNTSGPVTCNGPGTPWKRGTKTTSCSYTFTKSSAGHGPNNAFTATATITWEFSWTLDGTPQGTFTTIDGTTPFEIQVGEIQSISG